MILITGPGRSGTTFTTRLFKEMGFRLLPECYNERLAPAGLEGRAQKLCTDLAKQRTFHQRLLGEGRDESLTARLKELDADVIKAPHAQWVITDWLQVRDDIEHVIVCLRDPQTTIQRHHHYTKKHLSVLAEELSTFVGHTYWRCAVEGITPVTVVFPRSAREPDYLYDAVGHIAGVDRAEFLRVHNAVTRSNWIHQ